jgi:hypothetical protein
MRDERQRDGKGRMEKDTKPQKITASLKKTATSFAQVFSILIGVMLLVSLILVLVPPSFYGAVFTGDEILDPLIGAFL